MKKLKYNWGASLMLFVFSCICLLSSLILITSQNANAKETAVKGECETLGVRYETVYANGNRFLVFSNSSGSDIEVFAY